MNFRIENRSSFWQPWTPKPLKPCTSEQNNGTGAEYRFSWTYHQAAGERCGPRPAESQKQAATSSNLWRLRTTEPQYGSHGLWRGQDRAHQLLQNNKIHGIFGVGGYSGSLMISEVMHTSPSAFQKSWFHRLQPFQSFHPLHSNERYPPVQLGGRNRRADRPASKNVLDRLFLPWRECARSSDRASTDRSKAIAMTMLSLAKDRKSVRAALEKRSLPGSRFHATGMGDRAWKPEISQGLFRGVIDLAPGGVGEHLYGFMRTQVNAFGISAGRMGIPQIISTCG